MGFENFEHMGEFVLGEKYRGVEYCIYQMGIKELQPYAKQYPKIEPFSHWYCGYWERPTWFPEKKLQELDIHYGITFESRKENIFGFDTAHIPLSGLGQFDSNTLDFTQAHMLKIIDQMHSIVEKKL